MFNRRVDSFLPTVCKNLVEMQDIMNSEEAIMDIARREMVAAFANTFILTSDESGVIMFEKLLSITANPKTENLEFRRQRALNRLSMSPPFTFNFLKHKLDEIIGEGLWDAYIDFDNYTLYVESSAVDQNWYSEVEFTINRVKPCNMVFVNVPRTSDAITMNEQISYTQVNWRYRLGSWKLGQYPFATYDGGGVIKMPEIRSIQTALINDTANFVANTVSAVLLNDAVKVTGVVTKQVADNVAYVEYAVTPDMVDLITNIKLLKSDDSVLTQSSVYVPVTQPLVSKHTITIKEGV